MIFPIATDHEVEGYNAYTAFHTAISKHVTPTTASYLDSLAKVRTYLVCRNRALPNYLALGASFKVMAVTITRKRSRHISACKAKKADKRLVQANFYCLLYPNDNLWTRFYDPIKKIGEQGY